MGGQSMQPIQKISIFLRLYTGNDPEQNAGKIHASDREYLELNAGMIHWEYLLEELVEGGVV